jgi:hypothetical protein
MKYQIIEFWINQVLLYMCVSSYIHHNSIKILFFWNTYASFLVNNKCSWITLNPNSVLSAINLITDLVWEFNTAYEDEA